MNAPVKLAGYGLVLAAAVALGAVVGEAVGPIDTGGDDHPGLEVEDHSDGHDDGA